jgi:hypothetical protein
MGSRGPQPGAPNSGAPRKTIDFGIFEKLCALQCTRVELSSFFGIDEKTLDKLVKEKYEDTYSSVYKRFSESGKCSLRRYQWSMAAEKQAMAIWLGKQHLGQTDTPDNGRDSRGQIDEFLRRMEQPHDK